MIVLDVFFCAHRTSDMSSKSEIEEIRRERLEVQQYIDAHPFPSYEEMIVRIKQRLSSPFLYLAEYGEYNHNALKIIYTSYIEKETTKRIGELIGARGGFDAMESNYTVFRYCSPLFDSTSMVVRSLSRFLSIHWTGIEGWRD